MSCAQDSSWFVSVTAKPIFAFTQSLNCLCGLHSFCLPKQRSPYSNCLSILEPSIRILCPVHRGWAFRIRLVIQSSQQMLSIDLRLGKWNCPTISRLLYKVHVSHPYKRLVRTMVLSFVHLKLCGLPVVMLSHGTCSQMAKGSANVTDSCIDFFVQGSVTGNYTAKVFEIFHYLQLPWRWRGDEEWQNRENLSTN